MNQVRREQWAAASGFVVGAYLWFLGSLRSFLNGDRRCREDCKTGACGTRPVPAGRDRCLGPKDPSRAQ
jgi:hypothetical protein